MIIDTICVGCDIFVHVNDLGLCADCNTKLDRDLIRARDYLHVQNDEWVNFSKVSQHLYEKFYKIKPKRLGQAGKKYKSLLKFLQDYPALFVIREDEDKRSVYWIRIP